MRSSTHRSLTPHAGHASFSVPALALLLVGASFACSGTSKSSGFNENGGGPGGGGSSSGSSSGSPSFGGTGDGGGGGTNCNPNPANAEIADNGCDDDGDGVVDNVPTCDTGLAVDGPADAFAKAIAICDSAGSRGFGLVSASYSNGYGRSNPPHAGQWGILPKFGNTLTPREGKTMGVLSSGYAREWDALDGSQVAFVDAPPLDGTNYPNGVAPAGYPKAASGCDQDNKVNDMIDVKLVVKAPPNAKGFKFDFDFHSSEWPGYVCTNYNDAFIAYLKSSAFNNGAADNVSFDSKNNPVSVNNGFFDRCTPNSPTGCFGSSQGTAACPGGPGELQGTGFGKESLICDLLGGKQQTQGGATGWLTTQAPVTPGEEFTIEFMVWDAGDGVLDSSILIDKFYWVGGSVSAGTTRPPR